MKQEDNERIKKIEKERKVNTIIMDIFVFEINKQDE